MVTRTKDGFLWTPTTSGRCGLETEAVTASSQMIKDHYDAIVIGAGFAGLSAARDLAASHNISVLLIEARDRIGGRTCTVKALGEDFEIGGQWVHWWQPNVYRELSRYGLDRHLEAASGYSKSSDSNAAEAEDILGTTEEAIEAFIADFFTINGLKARELLPWPMDVFREPAPWKKYDHLSLRDRLDMMPHLPEEARTLIELNYTGNSGTDADNTAFVLALRWYALGGYTFSGTTAVGGTYRIGNGGMTSLARAILEGTSCDRSFGTEVVAVDQDGRGVTVTTNYGRTLTAAHVICTIPLNVLSTINFTPPLTSLQQEAITRGMPHKGGKIIVKLQEKQQTDIAGTTCGQSPFMFAMSDNYDAAKPATTAIAFTWPDGFSASNDLSDADTVVPALKQFLKPQSPLSAYIAHDWANDPYAKGAWMSFRPGEMGKYSEALQESHGRVVMASADWASGFAGFVDGAIEQGARAAVVVQRAMRTCKTG